MYVSIPPPPVLTLAVPAEVSMQRGTESQPLKLAPYQVVRATVAEGGLDRVMLNVRQQKLWADTEVPLKTGQQLNLQVVSTRPRIHLRIIEEAELKHLFRLLNQLGQNVRLPRALRAFLDTAKAEAFRPAGETGEKALANVADAVRMLEKGPAQLAGSDLAGLWQRLGLDMEALFAAGRKEAAEAGLKAVLLQVAARSGIQGMLPEGLERLLDQFTLYQLCRHRLAQQDVLFLPLPLSFLDEGYMLAERERRQGDDEGEEAEEESGPCWKMRLHLKLSVLGSLEIKLLFEGKTLRMRVLCESEETAAMVGRAIPQLRERLSTVDLKGFSAAAGAREPGVHLVKMLAPDGEHFLEAQV